MKATRTDETTPVSDSARVDNAPSAREAPRGNDAPSPRRERVVAVVAEVVRQAVADAGMAGVVLLVDDTPEGALLRECCQHALGRDAVWAPPLPADTETEQLHACLVRDLPGLTQSAVRRELLRLRTRLMAGERQALLANPSNKTTLLLEASPCPDPLLPLGDLYASQILELTGRWTGSARIRQLAESAGGIETLDLALRRWADERRARGDALSVLSPQVRAAVNAALDAGRFARQRVGLVPKIGPRTLGIDLFA